MKLAFSIEEDGRMWLYHAECESFAEVEELKRYIAGRVNNEPASLPAPAEPEAQKKAVTRAIVSQAAISLVQTKGRAALEPILAKYKAKRISEIQEGDLAAVYFEIQEAAQ